MARRMSFFSSKVASIIAEWNCVVVTTLQTKPTKLTSVALFETDKEKRTFNPVVAFSVQHVSNNLLQYISFRRQNALCPVDHSTRSVSTSRVFGWSAAQVSVLKEFHCTARTRTAQSSRTAASWSPRLFPCKTTSSHRCSRWSGHFSATFVILWKEAIGGE